jgi:hypothetical protein
LAADEHGLPQIRKEIGREKAQEAQKANSAFPLFALSVPLRGLIGFAFISAFIREDPWPEKTARPTPDCLLRKDQTWASGVDSTTR